MIRPIANAAEFARLKAAGWRPGPVRIEKPTRSETAPGWLKGAISLRVEILKIRGDWCRYWVVGHEPTGYRMALGGNLEEALAFLERVESLTDWASIENAADVPLAIARQARQVKAELGIG